MRFLIIILVCLLQRVYMAPTELEHVSKTNFENKKIKVIPISKSSQDLIADDTIGIGCLHHYVPFSGGYRGFYGHPFYHFGYPYHHYPYYGYGHSSHYWHHW